VVLLTDGSRMPPETAGVLRDFPDAPRFAIGAAAAAADPDAEPIVGTDPVDSAHRVAKRFFPEPHVFGFATTASFADALSGGLHAALVGAPLLYTNPKELLPSVEAYLSETRASVVGAFVYGGTTAISEAVRASIEARITG
jgi:hypothetical protein